MITFEKIIGTYKYRFTVLGDAKTVVPPKVKEPKPDIESLARDFAWKYNSNDLREFIGWLKEDNPA